MLAGVGIGQRHTHIGQHTVLPYKIIGAGALGPGSQHGRVIQRERSQHQTYLCRRRNCCTLHEEDWGRESTIKMRLGTLKPDSFSRQNSRKTSTSGSRPLAGTIAATSSSPQYSWGRPKAAASRTSV